MRDRDGAGARAVARDMLGEIERTSRLAAAAMVGLRGFAAKQARSAALRKDRDERWSSIVDPIKRKHARQDDEVRKQIQKRLDDLLLPTMEPVAKVSEFATQETRVDKG